MKKTFIPQTDPKAGYLAQKADIDAAVARVLESGWYILGQEVRLFESEFSEYIGTKYAAGVASGTDAIEIALRACDIGDGDLVFTVSHTAVATVAAIERAGAKAVFVDIDPDSFTMDSDHLESVIKSMGNNSYGHPKAIIPVHLYGSPAEMSSIMEIAQRYGLYVIEDCAQAHGAQLKGQMAGTFGDLAAFSFYPTKNIGTFGDGGIVTTDNKDLYKKLLALRQYGWEERYISSVPGINSRLDEIQAAILRVKLKSLDVDNSKRRKIAEAYTKAIDNADFKAPKERTGIYHVYHQYVIRTEERQRFIDYLKELSIGSTIHYPLPVHMQPAYKEGLGGEWKLNNTEKVCAEIVSLPMFPQLSAEDTDRIVDALKSYRSR